MMNKKIFVGTIIVILMMLLTTSVSSINLDDRSPDPDIWVPLFGFLPSVSDGNITFFMIYGVAPIQFVLNWVTIQEERFQGHIGRFWIHGRYLFEFD